MKEIPCACIHRKHFCRNPASDALDGQQPTNEKKRTFSYLAMEGEARTASILSQYNGLWYECDRSMSKTIKRGIFECSSVLEDRFPRILWEEKVEPAEPAKRQQICHFIMEESLCIPRRARLLRSRESPLTYTDSKNLLWLHHPSISFVSVRQRIHHFAWKQMLMLMNAILLKMKMKWVKIAMALIAIYKLWLEPIEVSLSSSFDQGRHLQTLQPVFTRSFL
ncbi:hypothetical protein IV203_011212 [Nitzschia inconspicua]|uniref:Uncharacterized protein n=1 Tax=Nitzschia inconspicua TaxID=303405 RepID=A0A9K3K6S9_9STRA|nr:hypothetical protein IV203_011212 [Nitzschia inconspicua]